MNIKTLIAITVLLGLFSASINAAEKVRIVNVVGFGTSYGEAVQNGLIDVLKQTKGVSIESQQTFSKSIQQIHFSDNGVNSHLIEVNEGHLKQIREVTSGYIREYRVVDSNKIGSREWEVSLSVKMVRYETPGHSPNSRRKLAVLPFRTTKNSYHTSEGYISANELSRQLSQKLVTEVTQTRKFAVLDRDYMYEFLKERNLILSTNASISEQMKIGEMLGVDYMLLGTITGFKQIVEPYEIQVTGERGNDNWVEMSIDYRIIVMATRQIKWSDSIILTLDNNQIQELAISLSSKHIQQAAITQAAKEIIYKAMENIYPLRVVKVHASGEVILNQGGVTVQTGELLEVYHKGEALQDPYTGETLGAQESYTGLLEVNRVTAKISYANLIEGDILTIREGDIIRRKPKGFTSYLPAPGMESRVEINANGGVVLPFDRR